MDHKLSWRLAGVLVLVLAAAAAMGVAAWTAVSLYGGIILGWFAVATLIRRDVDRLGGGGDWIGRTAFLFPGVGLLLWLVKRRRLRRDSSTALTS